MSLENKVGIENSRFSLPSNIVCAVNALTKCTPDYERGPDHVRHEKKTPKGIPHIIIDFEGKIKPQEKVNKDALQPSSSNVLLAS
ncbi:MAG: hypothetical protein Q8P80_00560 [Candidatus Levybacteria bacterium]|nr:hypothetical protein [Candidatus Levybacteria bacterium]